MTAFKWEEIRTPRQHVVMEQALHIFTVIYITYSLEYIIYDHIMLYAMPWNTILARQHCFLEQGARGVVHYVVALRGHKWRAGS